MLVQVADMQQHRGPEDVRNVIIAGPGNEPHRHRADPASLRRGPAVRRSDPDRLAIDNDIVGRIHDLLSAGGIDIADLDRVHVHRDTGDLDGAARESIQHELPFAIHQRPAGPPLCVFPGRADRHFKDGAILLEQVIDAAVVRRLLWRDRLGAGRSDGALDPHHFFAFLTGGFSSPAGSPPGSTTLPSLAESFRRSTSPAGISVPGDASRNAAAGSPSSTTRARSAVSHRYRSATSTVSSPSAAWRTGR